MNAPPTWAAANNASTTASNSFSRRDISVSRITSFGIAIQMPVARHDTLAFKSSRFVQCPQQSLDTAGDRAGKARAADASAGVTNRVNASRAHSVRVDSRIRRMGIIHADHRICVRPASDWRKMLS
jgi:hypothetical protein